MTCSDDEAPTLIKHADAHGQTSSVALTIITGFLGAGKSTLLRHILTAKHGYRIAVVMNEFGDTADIEAKAINISTADDPLAQESVEILEFANGCLCCSIKKSGIAAIERLLQLKGTYDFILLETTGLADPAPIASMFWQNEEFASESVNHLCNSIFHNQGELVELISLSGFSMVLYALSMLSLEERNRPHQQMEEDYSIDGIGESLRQIGCADIILLNKVDLASEDEVISLEEQVRRVNPVASIHRTIKGQIDLNLVLGTGAYRMAFHLPNTSTSSLHPHPNQLEQSHVHTINALRLDCPILNASSLQKLDEWIRTILWESRLPSDAGDHQLLVLRCKGHFKTDAGAEYVLQGVRDLYELRETEPGPPNAFISGKLVLIGKGLDDATVRKSFESIFADIVPTLAHDS